MKEKVLICYILFGCLFFNSCGTKRDNNSFSFNENRVNEVEAIKFMNTVNEYPIAIYEKTFWQYREEHAKLLIKNSGFIDDIKSIKDTTSIYFKDYNYAFIVRKDKEIDTLYSDYTLKSWILKKGNKNIYFYDEKG